MPRYVLREGSRGGERDVAVADDARDLLPLRDRLRTQISDRHAVYDVIDTDAVDLGEHGIVDRCPDCGAPELASRIEAEGCALAGS